MYAVCILGYFQTVVRKTKRGKIFSGKYIDPLYGLIFSIELQAIRFQ